MVTHRYLCASWVRLLFCKTVLTPCPYFRERERKKHDMSFSHLGLIRGLTPLGVRAIICTQIVCNTMGNPRPHASQPAT